MSFVNYTIQPRNMKTVFFFFLLAYLSAFTFRAEGQPSPRLTAFSRIDSQSVWHPPDDFREKMDKRCSHLSAPAFQVCFISLMRELGASPEALRFAALTDTTGYVRHFRNTGNVDIAYVFYPFRANENYGIMLVNGNPGMIDVDDFSLLDLTALKRNSVYLKILRNFPDAALWPGDRFHLDQPKSESLSDGGQRFTVSYLLQNGCRACERIGSATFTFDFNSSGEFLGATLVRVVASTR